jgi:zinc transporter 2
VDPLCTLIFSIIVVFTTVPVTKDCLLVLMEASPVGIDSEKLLEELKQIVDVVEVHDLHVWSLASGKPCLSAHIISINPVKTLRKATRLCR